MNGGMSYPRAFRQFESRLQGAFLRMARKLSAFAHWVLRGKLEATTLLVANERTRAALPRGTSGKVELLVENGVDVRVFDASLRRSVEARVQGDTLRAIFVGRLVDWKSLDIALEAIAQVRQVAPIRLDVIGDGPMRAKWQQMSAELGLADAVRFHGFVPQPEVPARLVEADVLLLPSVYECGGAVVLEAMGMGLPSIATAWGGPSDYLDEASGFLVPPDSRKQLVAGFADALQALADDPQRAARLGAAARNRVATSFDWRDKIQRMQDIYLEAIARYAAGRALARD
jgi:glycosyltransferase involved in cell wall biosynthesis